MAQAIKAITPKQVSWGSARNILRDAMKEFGDILLKRHQDATSTWDPKVDFDVKLGKVSTGTTELTVEVTTKDERYLFVDQGTRRHWVEPKRASVLAFPSSYTAKTRPGEIGSSSGGGSGPIVFSKGHWVSGIEPRHFSEQIADRSMEDYERIMYSALEKVAKEIERMAAQGQ